MREVSLPPLQLLATFEVAAREGSFRQAAQVLCITPSAVSQQIKALEDALAVALFVRSPGAVALTEAGARYLSCVCSALTILREGTHKLREPWASRRLRVSADSHVTSALLIPGIREFQRRHADIELELSSSSGVVDLQRDPIDVAVRYGRGPWSGVHVEELLEVQACLVASPELLQERPLTSLSDLEQHTLLEVRNAPDHWSLIVARGDCQRQRRMAFDSYSEALQAARHGLGVAIGLSPVLNPWLRVGHVKLALPQYWAAGAFYFVCRPEDRSDPALRALCDWLRARFLELAHAEDH